MTFDLLKKFDLLKNKVQKFYKNVKKALEKKLFNTQVSLGKFVKILLVILAFALILMPVLPEIVYRINCWRSGNCPGFIKQEDFLDYSDEDEGREEDGLIDLDSDSFDPEVDAVYIPAVGIKAPVVEGETEDALSRGAWRRPMSSTPDAGGNTVITGHRFQYLPPNNLTFYHLDKVQKGDEVVVYWDGMQYDYIVEKIFVVEADAVEIEENTSDSRLTLYTCTPLWTAQKRLVVVAKPAEE
jgi:LPXTG-site transpeptidase (sortase) family protein